MFSVVLSTKFTLSYVYDIHRIGRGDFVATRLNIKCSSDTAKLLPYRPILTNILDAALHYNEILYLCVSYVKYDCLFVSINVLITQPTNMKRRPHGIRSIEKNKQYPLF